MNGVSLPLGEAARGTSMTTATKRGTALGRENIAAGIGLMVLGMFLFSINDALGKWLAASYTVAQILLFRSVSATVVLVPVLGRERLRQAMWMPRPWLECLRVLLATLETICFYAAVAVLPLADAVTYYLAGPIYVTLIAALFLGEKVGWRRWLAVMFGFLGVLIILRPGLGVFQPAAAYALACAVSLAFYNILTRKVSRYDGFLTTFLFTGVIGAGAATAFGLLAWSNPTPGDWGLIGALCITSILGHFLLIRALESAPAAVLQPFHYLILVWAIILGFVFFDELPDLVTLTGGAVVVASGLFVVWREHAASRRAP